MIVNNIVTLPNGLEAIVIGGVARVLAKLPPDPAKRMALPPFAAAAPLVPRSEWRSFNFRSIWATDRFILDQQNHGSCVGFSSAGALMRLRSMEGFDYVRLSGAYTYSWINGNRDQGAIISDSLQSLQTHGTCTEAEVPWSRIYRNQIPASADQTAQRFRILEAYRADTFDEIVSGLQLGFIGVGAVMVGNTFTRLDGNGVAGFDRGPGNHAVCFAGVVQLPSGEWVLDLHNSWGQSFGQSGCCYVTQRHIESVQQDCYLIRAATSDPQGTQPPVAAV